MFSMKYLLLFFLASCSQALVTHKSDEVFTNNARGCFLLYNLKTDKLEKEVGETCRERFSACSTFKLPLAVMAFDSGVLKDEKHFFKWDGKKRFLEAWNKDHTSQSWIKESVVWFSQKLTPKLGEKRIKKYLELFDYGNQDMSTGVTQAWLNAPNDPKGSLAISAYEQVEWMKKLWMNKLPVSKRAMEITQSISYLETSPKGAILSGKTGSNRFNQDGTIQLGWFISHVQLGDKEYIAVTNLADKKPFQEKIFGGFRAKEITKAQLKKAGLWD